ncbi:uncharacterized protein LOC105837265 [Monomorium pharaonis]|uniref:uncharacterized protein LOC105837265 n=1 Tax=Monomorium pharaonis TaxID=307658 RepID=UPI00063EFC1B|nr:uncharacterized protein LOC105837265 [Monomorium pharaonis]
MEISNITCKNKQTKIETKTENSREISTIGAAMATAATVNVTAGSLDLRSITTNTQGNNTTIFGTNTFFGSKRKRRKRKTFNPNFNFLAALSAPHTTASTYNTGVKRPQSYIDSPRLTNNQVTKKFKVFDNRIQAINDSLTRALVSTNNTPLDMKHLTLVRGAISAEINKIAGGNFVPKFYESYIKFGAIVIKCIDEASVHWLSTRIGNISPWPKAEFRIIMLGELQKYFRALVWIPGPLQSTQSLLRLLHIQNPNLNTANWQIFAENLGAFEDGRSLLLGVPDLDYRKLQASDFMAYLGLDQIRFVFCDNSAEAV